MKQKILILTALLPLSLFAHDTATTGTAVHGVEHGLLALLPVVAVVGALGYAAWRFTRASR
ncbi:MULTISPECIES: hypothetical protein [unclassified Lentimonas]|uniref:hypothetical protein n=1 Tax=unclassified Lentimonas TaxID=2630993 RepID=UPI00132AF06A|nr:MULTISPECIES: hypothetical protein [unclassified Lentimonas]CAA6679571.1 Unannotated [Lentimonas sp. CC4]CAA6687289.1 Unannotated [Lentimonas sp. CC6]CAA6696805.1 Unannotated [Lentimonas sp. CC19]CAA6697399.1 Unannotated [Lentimonas sp. CC10]CAA7071332.1 Unannotated [Lentimonas sp. CC11]